ncbi:hypothetical protein NDU88_012672 [Pleurodeles waltl]|uniref:Uncharacterized protein n=1 Tax=Pleurodeles waltl TaxID=8319 RepID=A0AAV7R4H5_PLEWA|nr:hypothetical protein NDU88_012672 [Pleurodeles waltl]
MAGRVRKVVLRRAVAWTAFCDRSQTAGHKEAKRVDEELCASDRPPLLVKVLWGACCSVRSQLYMAALAGDPRRPKTEERPRVQGQAEEVNWQTRSTKTELGAGPEDEGGSMALAAA